MDWKQDGSDHSWFATDSLGYFYRVVRTCSPNGGWFWACAWSETRGLRVSMLLSLSADDAKFRMDAIAAKERTHAQT